jgi:hypothetical protein
MRVSIGIIASFLSVLSTAQNVSISTELNSMERVVTLTCSDQVEEYVKQYKTTKNKQTQQALDLFLPHDQQLRAIFIEAGVPEELRYLALSYYLDMKTSSTVKGPFYLTKSIALENNLTVTSYVDERLDLLKSAKVFCTERAKQNEKISNWPSAIMLYAAEGKLQDVNQISAVDTFSKAAKSSPYTISSVYPKYVAAVFMGKKYEDLGFTSVVKKPTEAISVKKYITLYQLSRALDINYKELKRFNPAYVKETVPNDGAYYQITLPAEAAVEFVRLGDTAYNYPVTKSQVTSEIKTVEALPKNSSYITDSILRYSATCEDGPFFSEVLYTVQKGDILMHIADLFDCQLAQLKTWNGLGDDYVYNSYLNTNKKLVIKVDCVKLEYYQQIEKMTREQKNIALRKD